MIRTTLFAAALAGAMTAMAHGQASKEETKKEVEVKPLAVGDPARAVDIQHWIKGDAVKSFESGKVYVLEFWATWCGPCRASMPHISDVQTQYKDYGVTFIGVSDEELPTVVKFLCSKDKDKLWFEKIAYTLATDPDRSVYTDYMKAAGQNGIPTAFIIGKDQHIEWIGHPMGIDKPLEAVVKDTWDRNEFKATFDKEQAAEREAMKAQAELNTAMKEKNWDKVMSILDKQIEASDGSFGPSMRKFTILLTQMDQPDKAYAWGHEIAKKNWDEAMVLNQMAWFVVDSPTVKTRDLAFAHKLASRANELTEDKDAAILDTFARVYYEQGDLKNAIRIQKKAVEFAPEGPMAEDIANALKKYEEEFAKKGGN